MQTMLLERDSRSTLLTAALMLAATVWPNAVLCAQHPLAPTEFSPAASHLSDQHPAVAQKTSPAQLARRPQSALTPVAPTVADELAQLRQEYEAETAQLRIRIDELARQLEQRMAEQLESMPQGDNSPVGADTLSDNDASLTEEVDESVPDYFDLDVTSPTAIEQETIFGPGFQIQSRDAEYRLQIHYESQIEARMWSQADQLPANSGFFLPRQRFFFNGQITKLVEYELAINRGVNNINLLNAFLNFHLDDRLQLRIGRFFTPLLYDQFAISNYWLLAPERSLFTTNLSLNRQIGAMAWGYLLDKQVDYAAGIFNGSRNSFESRNHGVDFVGYLNVRPFQNAAYWTWAENLNLGASTAYGSQDQAPVPMTFRIGAGSPDANIPGIATVPFLVLNPDVVERGERLLGSVHAAYFHGGLSVIGEWQYGYGNYASHAHPTSEQVPFSGFYVMSGYFLTGEQVERRTRVRPLRPLIPLNDDQPRGWGAIEPVMRVSQLRLGDEVFAAGFSDPALWSNSAITTELGVNWYWNDYLKFYLTWLDAGFGEPVQYRPGQFQKHVEMLWMRCQLYF